MISFWLYNLLSLTTACFEVPLFLWLCKCQKTWGKQFMKSQNFHDCGAPRHLWHLGFFKNHLKLVNLILVHIFRNGTKTPKMTNLYLHEDLFTLWYSLWGKNKKPAQNDHIWLVVVLWRCFLRWSPAQDDHFWVVPRVVITGLTVMQNNIGMKILKVYLSYKNYSLS